MEKIDDDLLIEAYIKAVELNLERDFISILEQELKRREIVITHNLKPETVY
ncbi:sporulation histidine kinase inhibitor Sda [Bacillus alkalicellulosilyticus]|uniref:sporulation histidine kinase inhibitor Sda n=1 Tax=Alkalihalobacterium alkalicellulosilyticum TaxID=1912214 RepID=UPI000996BC2A|nr:sporulation histidine kinase inhibitor Sda [Bacillus alkalicellulosilyticus]